MAPVNPSVQALSPISPSEQNRTMPRPALAAKVSSQAKKASLATSSPLKREVCIRSTAKQASETKPSLDPLQTLRNCTPDLTSACTTPASPSSYTGMSPITPSPNKHFPSRRITRARPSTPVTTPVTVEIKSSKYSESRQSTCITKIFLTPSPAKSRQQSSLPTTPLSFELHEVGGSIGRNGQFTPGTRTPASGKNGKFESAVSKPSPTVQGESGMKTPKRKLEVDSESGRKDDSLVKSDHGRAGGAGLILGDRDLIANSDKTLNFPTRSRERRSAKVKTSEIRGGSGIQSRPTSSTKRPAILHALPPSSPSKPLTSTLPTTSLRSPIRINTPSNSVKRSTFVPTSAAIAREEASPLFKPASPPLSHLSRPAVSTKGQAGLIRSHDTPNEIEQPYTTTTQIPSAQYSLILQSRNTLSENRPLRSVVVPGNLLKKTITLAKVDMDPRRRLPESKGTHGNVPEGMTPKKMPSTPMRSRVPVPTSAIKSVPSCKFKRVSVRTTSDGAPRTPSKGVQAPPMPEPKTIKTPNPTPNSALKTPARINSNLYKPITHPRTPFTFKSKNDNQDAKPAAVQSPTPKKYEHHLVNAEHVAEMVRMWKQEEKANLNTNTFTQMRPQEGSTTPPLPAPIRTPPPPSSLPRSPPQNLTTPTRQTTTTPDVSIESHTPTSTPSKSHSLSSPDLTPTNLFDPRTPAQDPASLQTKSFLQRVRCRQGGGKDGDAVWTPSKETANALDHAIDRHLKDEIRGGRVFTPGGQKLSELLGRRGVS